MKVCENVADRIKANEKRIGKRAFDLLFSLTALIVGLPLYLAISLLVKATSPGPALYCGLRMGHHGKVIHCWKFRTMCENAEKKLQYILDQGPEAREAWNTYHKLKKDPRLTPIGGFLRKTSLDELPQFWDVLMGRLSVVGPRPIEVKAHDTALKEIQERYKEKTDLILSAKPGITCLWQIRGRNALTFAERTVMEEEYVKTQSFWLDLKIIAQTIWILLKTKGAY